MRHLIRSTSHVALLMLLTVGVAWAEGDDGSEACAMCHDGIAADITTTAHALVQRGAPDCQTCHGDGTAHIDGGGDPALIVKPAGAAGEQVCRECHARDLGSNLPSRSAHRTGSVFCFDCHSVHGGENSELRPSEPDMLCASCHTAQSAAFRRPFGHDLERGVLQCSSCHDPHAGRGERSLRLDRSGEGPCVTCHAEKRGPFVFPHVAGFAGDCMSCHEPHGSTNPQALTRWRVDQLCLECHSTLGAGLLGSQPPSTHDLRSPRYRNCTVCHVAIHGSNTSPTLLR